MHPPSRQRRRWGYRPKSARPFVGVGLHRLPLGRKLVLHELPEPDLLLVFGGKGSKGLLVAQTVGLVPLHPVLHAVGHFQGHVQGVIVQPFLIGEGKGIIIIREVIAAAVQPSALLAPCGVGGAQDFKAAHIQSAVVHLFGVCAPFSALSWAAVSRPSSFKASRSIK